MGELPPEGVLGFYAFEVAGEILHFEPGPLVDGLPFCAACFNEVPGDPRYLEHDCRTLGCECPPCTLPI